jgi:hypothetical protein
MYRLANLIDTIDVINYNGYVSRQLLSPQFSPNLKAEINAVNDRESSALNELAVFTLGKIKNISDELYKLNTSEFKQMIRKDFYDPAVMNSIFNITNSIAYLQPFKAGNVFANERVKLWLKKLQRIGSESVKGVAFKSDLKNSKDVFVIKAPKDSAEDLIHEFLVGFELNSLRSIVPNFAYVFGGFKCTPPLLQSGYTPYRQEGNVISWCDNSGSLIQYIIYENIAPAISIKEYVSKCSFQQFLDKYLQVLFALRIAKIQKKFGHGDLHYENVLIKTLDNKRFSIPYPTDIQTIEYLETDALAVIIDYGFGFIESFQGPIGIVGYEANGVFVDKSVPLHDAYKLLMYSLLEMRTQKNFDCFNKAARLYRFFNTTEDLNLALNQQSKYYFMTPLNDKTKEIGLDHYLGYIRKNIPEFNLIVHSSALTERVIGCNGTDICLSEGEVIQRLIFSSDKHIDNIFDFYDIVSRLETEARLEDINQLLSTIIPEELVQPGIDEYYKEVENIKTLISRGISPGIIIQGIDPNFLLDDKIRSDYINHILDVGALNESIQRIDLLHDSLIFVNKYIPIPGLREIIQFQNGIVEEYKNDLKLLAIALKRDKNYLGPNNIKALKLNELEVLTNSI